jgi:hypothetical protein
MTTQQMTQRLQRDYEKSAKSRFLQKPIQGDMYLYLIETQYRTPSHDFVALNVLMETCRDPAVVL